jgi:peptidoglycan/LPS O-acetylase OafA/YrhL
VSRSLSIYLDLVRFAAAMTVFVSHMSFQRFTGGLFWQLKPLATDAVAVFFVLSGFVVAHVTAGREHTARSYTVARIARILSVALPAVALTALLDTLGRAIDPAAYARGWGFQPEHLGAQYFGALVFVNHIWGLGLGVGSNFPYWSLCFEVWYYAIFGLAVFAPPRWRVPACIALLAVVGPSIALLLPVWLMGVWAARVVARGGVGQGPGLLLCIGGLAGLVVYVLYAQSHGRLMEPLIAVLNAPSAPDYYVVGGLFTLHLVGFAAVVPRTGLAGLLERAARPIRWAAGATFTIYLFHAPIAQFLTTILPWPPAALATRLVLLPGLLALLFGIAALTERRKAAWRGWVAAAFDAVRPAVRRSA